MGQTYPWGAQSPAKRISVLDGQISANDKKREAVIIQHRERVQDLENAHKAKLEEFDVTDRQLKADRKAAVGVQEKERREDMAQAATKVFERALAGSGIDLEAALANGDFDKLMREAVVKAASGGAVPKSGRAKAGSSPAGGSKEA